MGRSKCCQSHAAETPPFLGVQRPWAGGLIAEMAAGIGRALPEERLSQGFWRPLEGTFAQIGRPEPFPCMMWRSGMQFPFWGPCPSGSPARSVLKKRHAPVFESAGPVP